MYRVLDLFSGTGSATEAFDIAKDCKVTKVDSNPIFYADHQCDIFDFWESDIKHYEPGYFHFIWASPPCKLFSIANCPMSVNWWRGHPKSPEVFLALADVAITLKIIEYLKPQYWALENPRGMLRTVRMMDQYPRRTVTYCQYGHDAMKPTDIWGRLPPTWLPKSCNNGDDCHTNVASNGISATESKSYNDRIHVPLELSKSLLYALRQVKFKAMPLQTLFDFDSEE